MWPTFILFCILQANSAIRYSHSFQLYVCTINKSKFSHIYIILHSFLNSYIKSFIFSCSSHIRSVYEIKNVKRIYLHKNLNIYSSVYNMYVSTVETTHFLLFIIDSFARNKETFFSLTLSIIYMSKCHRIRRRERKNSMDYHVE